MSHNVESMFYTRLPVWHGLGNRVEEALTSEEALRIAGLDWEVVQKDIYTLDADFIKMVTDNRIEGYKANVRSTDGRTLGIVTDKYQIVQNKDAFAFTDVLLADYKEQVKYETAGSLAGGKRIWMLARMPEQKILDDAVAPYLVFTTGHDGRHMVRVAITPVRVVCQNTLNLALGQAQRSWSTSHTGNIADKLNDAKNTLDLAVNYMSELNLTASELADKVITEAEFQLVQETLFPMPDNLKAASLATITNVDAQRSTLRQAYLTQDIEKFVGTGWGVIQAVSDMATHQQPSRKGINYQENLFAKTIDGHPMIDKAYEIVNAL